MAFPSLSDIGTGLKDFFAGKSPQVQQLPSLSPQQQGLQNQLIEQVMGLLQGGQFGQGFNFQPIAQQARTQFATQTVPGLAERFTALGGSGGGQSTRAFQSALAKGGAGLEQSLASLQSQLGLQQQGQQQNLLTNLLGLGLKSPFENVYQQGTQGAIVPLLQALAQALPFLLL